MKYKSIKINAILNIIYTLLNMLFPIITFPYVSRVLCVDLLGKVNFYTNISNYAIMLASLGLSTYGIRAVARVRNNKDELSKTTQELLTLNMFATIIVVALLMFSVLFVPKFKTDFLLLVLNCFLILSAPLGMNWLYSGLEQYSYITKRAIVFKTIALIAVFIFVHSEQDYIIYATILIISSVASYICNFIYAFKFIQYKRIKYNYKRHIKPMLILFASILAINVYTHLDTIMLGFINGDQEVGLYTTAVYVKTALLSMVNAISAVILPRISNYISEGKNDAVESVLKKSISVIMVITIPITIFFIAQAKNVIFILGGEQYLGAVVCMQIIMPVLLISGFSNIMGNQILIPLGKERYFMKAVICGAVADLVLNIITMPKLGCIGAAISTLIAEFVQMSIQFYYSKDYLLNNIQIKEILKIIISTAISTVMMLYVDKFIRLNILVTIIILFLVYTMCLCVSLFLLNFKRLKVKNFFK